MALRERDIEQRLQSMGFERGVAFCLKELAGENAQLEKALQECALQLTQMTGILDQFSVVAGRMKEAHDSIMRKLPPDDDDMPRVNDPVSHQ